MYMGLNADGLFDIISKLDSIQETVGLTDEESMAMEVAVQALMDIIGLMQGHPVRLDGDGDE